MRYLERFTTAYSSIFLHSSFVDSENPSNARHSPGESWIKHEVEEEQVFFVDSGALTCPE